MNAQVSLYAGPRMTPVVTGLLLATGAVFYLLAHAGLSGLYLLHAGLMLTAWCLIVPLGVLIARYFKVTRQQDFPAELDNNFWWNWHRALQYLGVAISTVGYGAMVALNGLAAGSLHSRIGLVIVVLGWCQLISAWARGSKGGPTDTQMRGDHYDMTPRRRAFEIFHKSIGWLAVIGAVSAAATGIELAGLPGYWQAALAVLVFGYLLAAWLFHVQRRHVSTYLAIWGRAEPEHGEFQADREIAPGPALKLRD